VANGKGDRFGYLSPREVAARPAWVWKYNVNANLEPVIKADSWVPDEGGIYMSGERELKWPGDDAEPFRGTNILTNGRPGDQEQQCNTTSISLPLSLEP